MSMPAAVPRTIQGREGIDDLNDTRPGRAAGSMIRIDIGGAVLAEIRVITNPLWEVFGSLSSLTLGRSAAWPYSEWNRAAERALMHRTGAELVAWFRRLAGPPPSGLTPMPDDTERDLEAELARVVDALPDAAWAGWFSTAVLDYWNLA